MKPPAESRDSATPINNPSPNPEKDNAAQNEAIQDVENNVQQPKPPSAFKSLGLLDRFLALWILLAMIVGIILGNFVPSIEQALDKGKFVGVSIPIAIGLLVMMYPILCKVRYESLPEILSHPEFWKQMLFSFVINWIIAPFVMLGLAWAFLPDEPGLRIGLILVGLARCIAMVLIWNGLAGGDAEYCAILVAVNSILQMALYAPMSVFFIRIISSETGTSDVSYSVVAQSVAVFLGIPLGAAFITRFSLRASLGVGWYENIFLKFVSPWSLVGLLYTILVLFASQGHQVVHQVVSVVRVAAPLVVYFILIFFATLFMVRHAGSNYPLSTTQSFTAASNNFELAIAVAIATYGPGSDQALASTVGPLIEVPVLLGLVYLLRWASGRWGWSS